MWSAKSAGSKFPARIENIAARAEGEPDCFGGERRPRLTAELENERDPGDHMIPVDILIEEAIAGGGAFQYRQVGNDGRKAVHPAEGFVPGESKARLRGGPPGLAVVGEYEARHGRDRGHSLGEPLIGVRQRGQELFRVPRSDAVLSHQRQKQFGRSTVRLGEVDIETDELRRRCAAYPSVAQQPCGATAIGRSF